MKIYFAQKLNSSYIFLASYYQLHQPARSYREEVDRTVFLTATPFFFILNKTLNFSAILSQ